MLEFSSKIEDTKIRKKFWYSASEAVKGVFATFTVTGMETFEWENGDIGYTGNLEGILNDREGTFLLEFRPILKKCFVDHANSLDERPTTPIGFKCKRYVEKRHGVPTPFWRIWS